MPSPRSEEFHQRRIVTGFFRGSRRIKAELWFAEWTRLSCKNLKGFNLPDPTTKFRSF